MFVKTKSNRQSAFDRGWAESIQSVRLCIWCILLVYNVLLLLFAIFEITFIISGFVFNIAISQDQASARATIRSTRHAG